MSLRATAALWSMFVVGLLVSAGCQSKESSQEETEQAPATGQPTAEPTREVAGVGVGKKGRKLEKHKGTGQIIAQPAVSYFRAKEKIVFEIVIPKNMQLFQATNGRFPKSHEEFMKEIIEFGQIQLPELPEGGRYVYDPKTHQLMVETK